MRSLLLCFALLCLSQSHLKAQIRPPEQPKAGPGGSQLPHAEVIKHRYESGAREYWIYEPDQPKPRRAPVIVFLHGWGGTNPAAYGAWLDHLVRRGNIVIYPRYQADLMSPVSEFTASAIEAIKNALERLTTEKGHIKPDLDKFAVVGHSMGGLLTANVAALAAESGLPKVRAMMPVEPGRPSNPLGLFELELADLAKIPADTLLLSVVGEDDVLVGDHDGKRIYHEATKVAAANKDFITLLSDDHGEPALVAGHYAPTGADPRYDNGEFVPARDSSIPGGPVRDRIRERIGNRQRDPNAKPEDRGTDTTSGSAPINRRGVDAMDFALWRLFDALCDAAFNGKNRGAALGNTPARRSMGKWSDGKPVKEMRITDKP